MLDLCIDIIQIHGKVLRKHSKKGPEIQINAVFLLFLSTFFALKRALGH